MAQGKTDFIHWVRTFLAVGGVAHVPTVWSNVLAAWLLSGGGDRGPFFALFIGVTCLYLGGAFLRFDWAEINASANLRAKPLQWGLVNRATMTLGSLAWFFTGAIILVCLGKMTAVFCVLLLTCSLLSGFLQREMTLVLALHALWRFLLYLVAASATVYGVNGFAVWCGLALMVYTLGVEYLKRLNTQNGPVHLWPCSLLFTPLLLAWLANGPGYRWPAFFLSLILSLWIIKCLYHAFGARHEHLREGLAGLTAGIIWVDILALAGGSTYLWVFLLWFAAARLVQRIVPAA